MLADAAAAKTAIVEYIVFTGEQSHERESSGELLAHLYWLTVLEEQKAIPGPRKSWGSASRLSARKSASWSG
jgi:hypothetical protein